ncbi:hypothetical protein ABTZ46_15500 [Nocardioides sp. NPDC126508]
MDADVVPGSVTVWTVTLDDQRQLKRAPVGLWVRSAAYWLMALGAPVLVSGLVWFSVQDVIDRAGGGIVLQLAAVTLGVPVLALLVVMPLVTVRRRVEREFPVGATLTAWATESGLGVRTLSRLTFYPSSRLTQVEVGPVLVRCRQEGPKTLTVPLYLPIGPDEVSRSVDFPAQLIGAEIRRELAQRAGRKPAEISMAAEPILVDRTLRWRLVRAWLRAQFGIAAWLFPAAVALNVAVALASGSYRLAAFWVGMMLFNPVVWLLIGEGRLSGMYPVGATVVGSVGEWLEIQGPWGSVAWHHTWLKQRRMTEHTVTYEMVQVGHDGMPSSLSNVDKRIVVIPRAFLDAPTPASAEV